MRGVARDILKKSLERVEEGVLFALPVLTGDDEACFGAVILVGVDQAVEELAFEEGAVAVVALYDRRPEARNREVLAEGGEPVFKILTAHRNAVFAADSCRGFFEGVETVVLGDGVEDDAQRETLVLVDEGRELLLAERAIEELYVAVLVPADTFADDALAAAVGAGSSGFRFVERSAGHSNLLAIMF